MSQLASSLNLLLLVTLMLVSAGAARSQDFELVAPDLIRMNTDAAGGIASPGFFFLVVGAETITQQQLELATLTSSVDNPALNINTTILNIAQLTPLLPGEASGYLVQNSQFDNLVMGELYSGPFKGSTLLSLVINHPFSYVGTGNVTGYLQIGTVRRHFTFTIELGSFGAAPPTKIHWAQRVAPTINTVWQSSVEEIPIAVHESIHGTLESVQMDVTLQEGSMNIGDGLHGHGHPLAPATEVTSFNDSHSHGASAGGSGGGVSVAITPVLAATSTHGHVVVGGGTTSTQDGGHFHSYGLDVDSQSFGVGQLAPFLAASDFVIPTGWISTTSEPSHSHHFGGGTQTDFQEHGHNSSAQWNTRTIFTFQSSVRPVPAMSPRGLVMLATALLFAACAMARWGRVGNSSWVSAYPAK
jgi:hypothetical protein